MHEMGITEEIIRLVLEECDGRSPESVVLEVGELSSYKPEPVKFYFEMMRKGTILEKSVLEVLDIKGKVHCNSCKAESDIDEPIMIFCPECESGDVDIIQGKDIKIQSIRF